MYSSNPSSSSSSTSRFLSIPSCYSLDDDINCRIYPDWTRYSDILAYHGYRCETFRDVGAFYEEQMSQVPSTKQFYGIQSCRGYPSTGGIEDLCKDRSLPDNLFRGTRVRDDARIIIKAVGVRSHEVDVITYLSSPSLRRDPANHTIPLLDIVRIPEDGIAFIVQEEWRSSFAHVSPCTLRGTLQALRQCIEGLAFMHSHRVAHLDVSLSNIMTNCAGSYSYIDFELSHRFDTNDNPGVRCTRGTEIPIEIERGELSCPYKVDIWALGVMILRLCKASGYEIRELLLLTRPMLSDRPSDRPSAGQVLIEFDRLFELQDGFSRRKAVAFSSGLSSP